MVERVTSTTLNDEVAGSIPSEGTTSNYFFCFAFKDNLIPGAESQHPFLKIFRGPF